MFCAETRKLKNEKNKKVLESTDDLVLGCVGLSKNVDQVARNLGWRSEN